MDKPKWMVKIGLAPYHRNGMHGWDIHDKDIMWRKFVYSKDSLTVRSLATRIVKANEHTPQVVIGMLKDEPTRWGWHLMAYDLGMIRYFFIYGNKPRGIGVTHVFYVRVRPADTKTVAERMRLLEGPSGQYA